MANRTNWTDRKRVKFLNHLSETGNVSGAARAVAISRSHAYYLREGDQEFAVEWDEAVAVATDRLEAEAWRRGHDGWDEPVWYKGEEVGGVRKYSDRMLELLLKAHNPKFREVTRQEHTGKGGGPVTFVVRYEGEDGSATS